MVAFFAGVNRVYESLSSKSQCNPSGPSVEGKGAGADHSTKRTIIRQQNLLDNEDKQISIGPPERVGFRGGGRNGGGIEGRGRGFKRPKRSIKRTIHPNFAS